MDAATIIGNVISQSGTDASRATVLSLLNEVYARQVVESRWLLETVSLGNTVAGTSDYSLADTIIDILALKVGATQFDTATTEQMWDLQGGNAFLSRSAGVWALTYSSTGGVSVTLFPTPGTSGDAISVLVPATATDLTDSGSVSPVTPADTHGSLIDGTTALILLRIDERPDLAQVFEQRYLEATERLRRRKNSRGGGPVTAQIEGIHFQRI